MPVRPRLLALAIALCFHPGVQGAESVPSPVSPPAPDAGLKLPAATGTTPAGDSALGLRLPAYITADRIEGNADTEVNASGNAEIRRGNVFIGADSLRYSSVTEEVVARGNVRIERDSDRISGAALRYKTATDTGEFEKLQYLLTPRRRQGAVETVSATGRGGAERLEFQGEDHYRLRDATFTTCKPGNEGWYVKVADLDLDMRLDVGTARGATLYFLDTPILYAPWISFSLNNERKSGVLPPHIGSTSQGGMEAGIPYYFNIAPNLDLTLAGRYMEKRGEQLNSQLRYLQPNYSGEFRFEVLPEDKVLHTQRSALTLNHSYRNDALVGGLSINKVSDDSYFRDLSSRINLTAQTNLIREGFLGYSGSWWDSGTYVATLRVQKWQTLQDPNSPVVTPYARTPQAVLMASRQDVLGADFSVNTEFVDFAHPTQIVGRRITAYPSLSLPMLSPGGFFTPKIGLHATRYSLNRNVAGATTHPGRTLPIVSVDSGVVFERDTRLMGTSFVQTLEPRAYYLRVPYRDQDRIPLFDTAVADFNYAQIFSENSFVGGDRINDANQLTLALTSRLLFPGSGQEAVRATLGQRFYLTDQEVTLNPTDVPRNYGSSDWLAALSGRITSNWTAEGAMQHNPREHRSERFTLSARYQPEMFKILNLSYRFLRDKVAAVDVSGQWPLGGGFYGVARYNYSMRDGRAIEMLGGLEYNGDCWVLRGVMQRFATATGQTTNTFFLQLELSGFSRIGSNPLEVLKRNIPGYARLNQPSANQNTDYFD